MNPYLIVCCLFGKSSCMSMLLNFGIVRSCTAYLSSTFDRGLLGILDRIRVFFSSVSVIHLPAY